MPMEDSVIRKNKDYPESYAEAAKGILPNKQKNNLKLIYALIVILAVLAAFSMLAAYQVYRQQLSPVSAEASDQYITVESGMSSADVASMLYEEGVIRSPLAFRAYARLSNTSHAMQAGVYSLSPTQSSPEILSAIGQGDVASMAINVPEGSTLSDFESVLSEAGFSAPEIDQGLDRDYDIDILRDRPEDASLEGYIYPDTYHVNADADITEVVRMALENTEAKVSQEIIDGWSEQGLDIHQGLTMASIVQKESPTEDMRAIAGVFYNRIDEGRKLESDATVNYVHDSNKLQSSAEDIAVDDPYNTYQVSGLPPGPIINPELEAIRATSDPEDHDWLFFLHRPSGETMFSRTFEEHLDKQRRYLD